MAESEEQDNAMTNIALEERIKVLEVENKKIRDEFNVQRAKMKDLFLQKEEEFNNERSRLMSDVQKLKTEIDESRSELLVSGMTLERDLECEKRKANEEIATLQQLLQETVEESSASRTVFDTECKKLQYIIKQLQDENRELKLYQQSTSSPHHHAVPQHQEPTSLGPGVMLSAVTKTLARKLGADAFSSQESLEESMRKAQEDAEMLRSLVLPLEEEIKALKDKLRSTDDQLQQCKLCRHNTNGTLPTPEIIHIEKLQVNSEVSESARTSNNPIETSTHSQNTDAIASTSDESQVTERCDMCSNYEAQLVREQQRNSELEARLVAADKAMERHKEDLLKEIGFRKDMEEKWNEKKEEHKQQVSELNKRTLCTEQDLQQMKRTFSEYEQSIKEQLQSLVKEREQVHEKLTSLQKENDHLVGKYSTHSEKLQSETINIPDTIEELQEKVLNLQEELIIASIGKESAQEKESTLHHDIILLREEISQIMINDDEIKKRNELLENEMKRLNSMQDKFKMYEKSLQQQLHDLKSQLNHTTEINKQLEETNQDLKAKVSSLQKDIANSEAVQKDFVRLSQSLQVELEKIRASDVQVRWQHDDDVEECPNCRSMFNGPKKKQHCRHCGQIFCTQCLNHNVPSGPKQRAARVCDVCHTLLVKSSAPYFSTAAPHSPD